MGTLESSNGQESVISTRSHHIKTKKYLNMVIFSSVGRHRKRALVTISWPLQRSKSLLAMAIFVWRIIKYECWRHIQEKLLLVVKYKVCTKLPRIVMSRTAEEKKTRIRNSSSALMILGVRGPDNPHGAHVVDTSTVESTRPVTTPWVNDNSEDRTCRYGH